MKLNKLILILLLGIRFSASSTVHNDKIEFIIKDKYITDKSFITLLITNKTSINYYLPIINSSESEKWRFILSKNENSFFFLDKNIYDKDGNQLLWHNVNYEMEDPVLRKLDDHWVMKRKNIKAKDFFLLNSGDSLIIKIPMNLLIKISDNLVWSPNNFEKEDTLYVSLLYRKKSILLQNELLNKKNIEKLKKMGYKLYTDEIISNKVFVITHR
jgi:hypothetical protein